MAGIGGPAGLKGSDDVVLINAAQLSGAQLRAPDRALRCMQLLASHYKQNVRITTYSGVMGEDVVRQCGFVPDLIVGSSKASTTSAKDTCDAVQAFIAAKVDLILFVGGDGTARDVCSVLGDQLPVLGIPSGVKMHSGVFALSPESAYEVIQRMLLGDLVDVQNQEVRDIDERALREGIVNSRYFGEMQVPRDGHFVQQVKSGGAEVEELVLDDIGAELIERLEPDALYLIGAGTTPAVLMQQLNLENSLLGVDVICNEQLLHADVSSLQLENILQEYDGDVFAVLSITGNQGSLIGRGNQQLSPAVLRRIGKENILVVATKTKIKELQGRPLLMDSNDLELDRQWQGFVHVITGYRDTILYPLGLKL